MSALGLKFERDEKWFHGIRDFLECSLNASQEGLGYALEIVEYKYGDEFAFEKFSLRKDGSLSMEQFC